MGTDSKWELFLTPTIPMHCLDLFIDALNSCSSNCICFFNSTEVAKVPHYEVRSARVNV